MAASTLRLRYETPTLRAYFSALVVTSGNESFPAKPPLLCLLFRGRFGELCVDLNGIGRTDAVIVGVRFGQFVLAREQGVE